GTVLGVHDTVCAAKDNRAGSPWGLPPRAPTDPDVPVEEASGSSRRALSLTRPGGFAVTRGRGSVSSACFQPPVHDAAPPSLPGVREGPFPRFVATMGHCDSLSSISPRFVSFAWRYHRSSPVRPHQLGTELWIILELVSRGSSRQSRWRREGLPSSRETRSIIRHVAPTPV